MTYVVEDNISDAFRLSIMPSDTIVFSIFTKNGLVVFDEPKLASEIKCPNCGCEYGILNLKGRSWHCAKACFSAKKGKEAGVKSIEMFSVPNKMINASLENCFQSKKILEFLKKYLDSARAWTIFVGDFGKGKTYAACALLEEYRRRGGEIARFLNLVELYEHWIQNVVSGQNTRTLITPYLDCDFLVIDDMGTREPSAAFQEFLFLLFDKRDSNKKLKTIITTNLSNEEIRSMYGGRILSRIASGNIVKFLGEDRRKMGIC